MRPKTIVYFEWIIFGVLLYLALQWYPHWNRIMTYAHAADRNFMAAYYIGVQLFKFVLTATLTLLVSRRRSKVAMWVSIALFASIVVATLVVDITIGRTTDIITLAVLISQGVAYGLLFTPSARRWMSRKDEKNEKLREVFE